MKKKRKYPLQQHWQVTHEEANQNWTRSTAAMINHRLREYFWNIEIENNAILESVDNLNMNEVQKPKLPVVEIMSTIATRFVSWSYSSTCVPPSHEIYLKGGQKGPGKCALTCHIFPPRIPLALKKMRNLQYVWTENIRAWQNNKIMTITEDGKHMVLRWRQQYINISHIWRRMKQIMDGRKVRSLKNYRRIDPGKTAMRFNERSLTPMALREQMLMLLMKSDQWSRKNANGLERGNKIICP